MDYLPAFGWFFCGECMWIHHTWILWDSHWFLCFFFFNLIQWRLPRLRNLEGIDCFRTSLSNLAPERLDYGATRKSQQMICPLSKSREPFSRPQLCDGYMQKFLVFKPRVMMAVELSIRKIYNWYNMQTFEIETMPAFYRSFLDTSHVEWRFLVFLILYIDEL